MIKRRRRSANPIPKESFVSISVYMDGRSFNFSFKLTHGRGYVWAPLLSINLSGQVFTFLCNLV